MAPRGTGKTTLLRADIAYRNADEELSFRRTRSGVEVDCVVDRGGRPLERSGVRWVPVDTFLRSLGP